jgi:hypothetical protein
MTKISLTEIPEIKDHKSLWLFCDKQYADNGVKNIFVSRSEFERIWKLQAPPDLKDFCPEQFFDVYLGYSDYFYPQSVLMMTFRVKEGVDCICESRSLFLNGCKCGALKKK